jgi:protein-S-isoprenylcysteine O-methyltransferase Ste14
LLLLCGFGLVLGSATVVMFSFVWCAAAHLFVISYEEPALRRQFGHHYEEYRRSVPRWIPARPKEPQTRGVAVGQ